jgi:hypothetical protein
MRDRASWVGGGIGEYLMVWLLFHWVYVST